MVEYGFSQRPNTPSRLNCSRCRSRYLLRILAALLAHGKRIHVQLLAAKLVVHFDLDGQAVAVPAGHVRRVEAAHAARLHHEILQAFCSALYPDESAHWHTEARRARRRSAAVCAPRECGRKCAFSPNAPSILGSFFGRFAFIEKSVLGRFSVDFRSSGTSCVSGYC